MFHVEHLIFKAKRTTKSRKTINRIISINRWIKNNLQKNKDVPCGTSLFFLRNIVVVKFCSTGNII